MSSLSKKLTAVLLAVAAALCLALGLHFTVQKMSAFADEVDAATLSEEKYFSFSDTDKEILTGLSADGISEAADKNIVIRIPATVKKISASSSSTEGILGNLSSKLVSLEIPSSVTEIGNYAFFGSYNLETLDLSQATALTTIGTSAFNSGVTTGSSFTLKTITVPENVKSIGDLAFANRTGLTTVNFYAKECADFTADSTASPFYRAGNNSGTEVTLNIGSADATNPVTVTKIPANLFLNNATRAHRLTYINFINANIQEGSFGANAFSGSRLLKSVDFKNNTSFEEIGAGAFNGCTVLSDVSIPAGVATIGDSAFQGCTALKTVSFGSNLTTIGDDSFNGCSVLTNVAIPETVTEIGDRAFNGCTAFTVITVPANVSKIGTNAFSGCTSAKTINYYAKAASFSNSQTTTSPFSNGANNVKLTIGQTGSDKTITSLPSHLFRSTNQNPVKISEVEFVNVNLGTEAFGNNLFTSCTSLASVKFTDCHIAVIGYAAFYGCTSLTDIDLPDEVETISEQAFYGCTSLSAVDMPSALETVEKQAFYNCSALYTVTIGSDVTKIDTDAFYGCVRLIEVCNNSDLTIVAKSKDNGSVAENALNVYKSGVSNPKIQNPDENGYVFYVDGTTVYLITYTGTEKDLKLPANYNGSSYAIYLKAFMDNVNITSVEFAASDVRVSEIKDLAFAGCTSLTSVDLTGGPTTMGGYVFQGCTELTEVTLPENLTSIGMYAFEGCTKLTQIEIPEKVMGINANAFQNCSALKTVTFASQEKLTYIYGSAFSGCTSLSVIRIPSSVTVIQASAFAGCSNLRTVYLPEKLTSAGTSIFPVSTGLILIAPSEEAYLLYLDGTLSTYRTNLTYKVEINLYYTCIEHTEDDAAPHDVDYRLFGRSYNLVEQEDGTWLANGGMPVQHGYTSSVWYQYSDHSGEAVGGDWLTVQLSIGKAINLYANTVEYPELTAKNNLVYNATQKPDWTELVNETLNTGETGKFRVNITGYSTYYTKEVKDVPQNLEAGYYTLTVTLAEAYGEWKTPYTLTVTVSPYSVDASLWSNWVQLIGSSGSYSSAQLAPVYDDINIVTKTLYIYKDGAGNEVPYLEKQSGDPVRTIEVLASYVSFTGRTVTIVLDGDGNYFNASQYYTVRGSYTENSKSDQGIYTASVTIEANNNYMFQAEELTSIGLRVTHVADTNTYVVYKTWYIAVNQSNSPLLGETEYVVNNWTYNSGKAPVAPSLVSGGEDELITFSLYRYPDLTRATDALSGLIANEVKYEKFDYYVNDSMPAGRYILTIYVDGYVSGDVSMAGGTYPYEFIVNYAFISGNLYGNLPNYKQLQNAQSFEYDGNAHVGDMSSLSILDRDVSSLHPNRTGFWALSENNYMYERFAVTFDIVAAQFNNGNDITYPASSGKYYTDKEYLNQGTGGSLVVPREIGVYRVYYNIAAPSYVGLFTDVNNQSSRETYFFTIKIYGVITRNDLPVVSDIDFTDSSAAPYVSDSKGWFELHYLDAALPGASTDAIKAVGADSYVNAGTHKIALSIRSVLKNAGLLVWSDEVSTVPNENRTEYYAILTFKINPSQNQAGSLYFTSWDWGTFDMDANRPVWSTKYVDYEGFTFTLRSTTTGAVYTYGATDGKGFGDADAGTYTLTAYAVGNTVKDASITSYNWFECSSEITVKIYPATIRWESTPYILSWKYGDYNNMYSISAGVLSTSYSKLAELMTTYFCLASDIHSTDASKHYASINDLLVDGEVPAGNYALVYVLEETVNYDEWVYPVYFSVLKADNYWDITPTVNGWFYGDTSIDYSTYKPAFSPHVGNKEDVVISYCLLDEDFNEIPGWVSNLAELGLDAKGNLPVGNYKIRATLGETANFESMEFSMPFTIAKAQNSWVNIPGVVSWNEGRWNSSKNAFKAADLFGSTVYITIEDSNGKVLLEKQKIDELNVNVLKSLSVGSYKFIAYVDETPDHEGLQSEVYFAVLEDSVGMTGLIAATMVFAVIAIGLAVAGAILLLRRNKKVEEEFRSLIKSELHRR